MSSTAMRWSARGCPYSPAGGGETDSRELKLVPFVLHTDRSCAERLFAVGGGDRRALPRASEVKTTVRKTLPWGDSWSRFPPVS